MPPRKRKGTNELEFQGHLLGWINEEIRRRPGLELDIASQEKPRLTSGKRNDLVVWKDRSAEVAFLTLELKTPTTPINDPVLFADAIEKAKYWGAPYFAIWNMQEAELYKTPKSGEVITPAAAVKCWGIDPDIIKVEDWLDESKQISLKERALEIVDKVWEHANALSVGSHIIDAELFVSRMGTSVKKLREILYKELSKSAKSDSIIRKTINKIASEQGFAGFVEDIEYAVAGQIGYRLIGQIFFYFALRRKQPSLKKLVISTDDKVPECLRVYWNDVRRFDYEALFKPEVIDDIIAIPDEGQSVIRSVIETFSSYDWQSLDDDVLGYIFESLIPKEEQIILGQFYTPRPVADLLVALTINKDDPNVLDPGCGSGTFLMSAYGYLKYLTNNKHGDLLSLVWGFDISPFAAELAAINLYRQNLSEFNNFPRIITGNFFEQKPGIIYNFPPPRASSQQNYKIDVPIPFFDCIIGNPPYLRSQNQDDLDPKYRGKLFSAAMDAGVKASAKTDLFAFFIYHALKFMKPGARLGFVTPASWLTSDFAAVLQRLLLYNSRKIAIISSSAESFFPQVDVNTCLLVFEKENKKKLPDKEHNFLRFANLKKSTYELANSSGDYWNSVIALVDSIYDTDKSFEDDRIRVKLIDVESEKDTLDKKDDKPNNWSKYLRAPLSYYKLFGSMA